MTALRSLVHERGYDEITVDDIAARADVGRSTFYLHFKGKDDLFRSSFEDLRAELLAGGGSGVAGRAPDLGALFLHAEAHRPLWRALAGSSARSIALAQMRRLLHDLAVVHLAGVALRPDIPRDLVARSLAGALEGLLMASVESSPPPPAEAVGVVLEALVRGSLDRLTQEG